MTEGIDLHGATPHILRHSYLTYAVGATKDFKTVQGISGHADVFTLLNSIHRKEERSPAASEHLESQEYGM